MNPGILKRPTTRPTNFLPQRTQGTQRGEAATEAERDRSPVAAAPHEAGCLVEPDVLLRAGPLRAATARAPPLPQILRSLRATWSIAVQRPARLSLHCKSRDCSQAAIKFSCGERDELVGVRLARRQERRQDAAALCRDLPLIGAGNLGDEAMGVQQSETARHVGRLGMATGQEF